MIFSTHKKHHFVLFLFPSPSTRFYIKRDLQIMCSFKSDRRVEAAAVKSLRELNESAPQFLGAK
jgi:hypothetical protein